MDGAKTDRDNTHDILLQSKINKIRSQFERKLKIYDSNTIVGTKRVLTMDYKMPSVPQTCKAESSRTSREGPNGFMKMKKVPSVQNKEDRTKDQLMSMIDRAYSKLAEWE